MYAPSAGWLQAKLYDIIIHIHVNQTCIGVQDVFVTTLTAEDSPLLLPKVLFCIDTPHHIGQTDCEQIHSRINNNDCRMFRPRRPLSTAYKTFCTQLTKAYMAETSCISCYWFCYISAHDQFARYRQSSNEPQHHLVICSEVYCSEVCSCHLGIGRLAALRRWLYALDAMTATSVITALLYILTLLGRSNGRELNIQANHWRN